MATPDYLGLFSINLDHPEGAEMYSKGAFSMYILDKEPLSSESAGDGTAEEGAERINGLIVDGIGLASFLGTISPQEVEFTKEYSPNAIMNGGADEEIRYRGKMTEEGFYKGEFQVGDQPKNPKLPDWWYTFVLLDPRRMLDGQMVFMSKII